MPTENKISVRQICFMILSCCLIGKILVAPALGAKYASEGLWISFLINFCVDGAFVFFVLKLSDKFPNKTFFDILENAFGKVFAKIIYFFLFVFLLFKAFIPIVEQKNYIEIALYETSPSVMTFALYFLFSSFFCYKGLKAVARCSDIVVWVSSLGIIILLALAVPLTDLTNLLPIIGVPFTKILDGAKNTFVWYFDGVYILLLIGNFKPEKAYKRKIMLSYAGMALITIIYSVILYGEFGALTERQYFSPIQMGKSNVALSNVGRIDYIAGFIFAFVDAFAISLPLVFASYSIQKVFEFKNKLYPVLTVNGALLISLFVAHDYFIEIFRFLSKEVIWGYWAIAYAMPLIVATAALVKRRKPQ